MRIKLNEGQLRRVVKESVYKILSEAFSSKNLSSLNKEHGGIKFPYYASELTDDEIGDLNPIGGDSYQFNDGTRVGLKLSPEHRKLWHEVNPRQNKRWDEHRFTDGAKEYKWRNRDAGTMVRNAKPNKDGKLEIDKSWKEETPMDYLNRRAGYSDDRCNWEHRYDDGAYSYNASPMSRAKADYATRRMTPQERHQYYKNNFGNRVIDHDK